MDCITCYYENIKVYLSVPPYVYIYIISLQPQLGGDSINKQFIVRQNFVNNLGLIFGLGLRNFFLGGTQT